MVPGPGDFSPKTVDTFVPQVVAEVRLLSIQRGLAYLYRRSTCMVRECRHSGPAHAALPVLIMRPAAIGSVRRIDLTPRRRPVDRKARTQASNSPPFGRVF